MWGDVGDTGRCGESGYAVCSLPSSRAEDGPPACPPAAAKVRGKFRAAAREGCPAAATKGRADSIERGGVDPVSSLQPPEELQRLQRRAHCTGHARRVPAAARQSRLVRRRRPRRRACAGSPAWRRTPCSRCARASPPPQKPAVAALRSCAPPLPATPPPPRRAPPREPSGGHRGTSGRGRPARRPRARRPPNPPRPSARQAQTSPTCPNERRSCRRRGTAALRRRAARRRRAPRARTEG